MSKVLGYIKQKPFVLIFLLGFLPLTWFRGDQLFISEEIGYLDYTNLLSKHLYVWSEHSNNGAPVPYSSHLAVLPIGLIYGLFDFAKLPPSSAQCFVVVLYFQVTLMSSYLLVRRLTKSSWTAVYASVFYASTFYNLSTFLYTSKMIQTAITPLLFYLFYEYLVTHKPKYIIYNFLLLFICLGLFVNPANSVVTLLVYPICFFYFLLGSKGLKIRDMLLDVSRFFLPILPLLFYVFLIFYYSMIATRIYEGVREEVAFANAFLVTKISSLLQNFKGAWWESQASYNPWISLLSNPLLIFSSLVLSFVILVGYYTIKTPLELKRYLYWLFLVLLLIFIAKGASDPLGFIYLYLFEHVPGLFIFRESWAKFVPPLIFCTTMAASLSFASLLKLKRGGGYVVCLSFLFLLINAFPFFTGGPFYSLNNDYRRGVDVKIPDYWWEARLWSKKNKDVNILPLPIMSKVQEYYDWHNEEVGNFVGYLPPTILFSNSVGVLYAGFPIHSQLFRYYSPKLFALLNIDYIFDQKDVVNGGLSSLFTVENLIKKGVINSKPDISFGQLDIYKITPAYFLPRIYSAKSVWNYEGGLDTATALFSLPFFSQDSTSVLALDRNKTAETYDNIIILPSKVRPTKRDFNTWNNGWAWPVAVSISPTSWKYKYVRLKEKYTVAGITDSLQKIDTLAWLAAKRSSELTTFNLTGEAKRLALEEYKMAARDVFQNIRLVNSLNRDDSFWTAVSKAVLYLKRSNQILYSPEIADEYNDFILWLENEAGPACMDYCFQLTVRKGGKYDILLNRSSLEGVNGKDMVVELHDGAKKVQLHSVDYTDDWFKVESLELESGRKYILSLVMPGTENVVPIGESDSPITVSSGSTVSKNLVGWLPEQNYTASFDYYAEDGIMGLEIVEDVLDFENSTTNPDGSKHTPTKKKVTYKKEFVPVCDRERYVLGKCVNHFSGEFASNIHSTGASLHLYGREAIKGTFPKLTIENISIKKVRNLIVFLKYGEATATKPVSIEFTKESPVKYKVHASSASSYDLIFSQNYNQGWKLYRDDFGNSTLGEKGIINFIVEHSPIVIGKTFINQHYVADGYANAWAVPKEFSGSDLVVEYWPQRYFYLIYVLLSILVVYSFIYLLRHRHE